MTRVDDALEASRLGVDAVGLVFYPRSKRHVEIEAAAAIAKEVPAFVDVVALFLDPEPEYVRAVLSGVAIDTLQFHGSETPEFCRSFSRPFIKAIGMRDNIALDSQVEQYHDAKGFLLDSHAHGQAGGTGETFDWDTLEKNHTFPLILAGGLNPDNVAVAIETVRPWAVDLSSGVESSPGIKDHAQMAALMKEVMRVNCEY